MQGKDYSSLFKSKPLHPNPYLAAIGCSITFDSRFWAKVRKTDDCWLWTVRLVEMRDAALTLPYMLDFTCRGIDTSGFIVGSPTLPSDAGAQVDAKMRAGTTNYLVIFAGTNDIGYSGQTPDTIYGYFTNYFNTRIAAGWVANNVTVCTMLPRENWSEVTRSAWNTLLINGASTLGYRIVRLDLDPLIGLAGCQSNLTYYAANQIHPNNEGQRVIATNIYSVLFP